MFTVSPEIYSVLSQAARYLFVFCAFLIFLFALSWLLSESVSRKEKLSQLPGAGTIGELVVLSGSRELSPQTWFPVPREGVLGSVRSCDLVVPCPGVRPQHLDFSWEDGAGLLVRPRSGCEVLVNGVPLDCRSDAAGMPLAHGACLQVGEAVLRLQLFAALDPYNRTRGSAEKAQIAEPALPVYDEMPAQQQAPSAPFFPQQAIPQQQFLPPQQVLPPRPLSVDTLPPPPPGESISGPTETPDPSAASPDENAVPSPHRRRRRTDSWKEDWSE